MALNAFTAPSSHQPDMLGRRIELARGRGKQRAVRPVTIVGVLPPRVQFSYPDSTDMWLLFGPQQSAAPLDAPRKGGVAIAQGVRFDHLGYGPAPEHRMKTEAQKDVDRIFRENRRVADEALKRGVRRAMLRHKNEGSSVVIERDGKIEWLKPEDLGF